MKTLGLEEAAKLLRIHPKTLARRAASGEVPGVKEGRAWVLSRLI
jgi:excisionase family DNA binding protein